MKIKLIVSYIKTYWLTVTFLGYMVGTTILLSYTSIDLTIPCLIRYFTGYRCYGCGLTTAATHLLRLDIRSALEANALVFVVLPVFIFLIIRHWRMFVRDQKILIHRN